VLGEQRDWDSDWAGPSTETQAGQKACEASGPSTLALDTLKGPRWRWKSH
jgi:hypothetical protein